MNRQFHFYDNATGVLHAKRIATDADTDAARSFAEANAPPGHHYIEGTYDHLSQRVDVETGKVVDYQPPAPSGDHVWNTDIKRWVLSDEARIKTDKRESALQQITALEAKQPRILREIFLKEGDGAEKRLHDIEEQIIELRKDL